MTLSYQVKCMKVDLNLVKWNSREAFLLQHSVDQIVLDTKVRKQRLPIIKCLLTGKAPEAFAYHKKSQDKCSDLHLILVHV